MKAYHDLGMAVLDGFDAFFDGVCEGLERIFTWFWPN